MLHSEDKTVDRSINYIKRMLHVPCELCGSADPSGLPVFLRRGFALWWVSFVGRHIVLAVQHGEQISAHQLQLQIGKLKDRFSVPVVPVLERMDTRYRSALVKQQQSFIVPDKQMYLMELGIDFREVKSDMQDKKRLKFSPTAQMILINHLLNEQDVTSFKHLSHVLNCSPMAVTRAAREISDKEVGDIRKDGRQSSILFKMAKHELFEAINADLKSPVRAVHYFLHNADMLRERLLCSGETALSQLTDLSPPFMPSFAVHDRRLNAMVQLAGLVEVPEYMAEIALESWSYPPESLSQAGQVDAISLYVQFRDHGDERVAHAADQLREMMPW